MLLSRGGLDAISLDIEPIIEFLEFRRGAPCAMARRGNERGLEGLQSHQIIN